MLKFFNKKKKSVRAVAVESLLEVLESYSEWYDQAGLYLPPKYATDPTGWSEAMHVMVRALDLIDIEETYTEGSISEAEKKEVIKGLKLLGENLYYMTDVEKPLKPAH